MKIIISPAKSLDFETPVATSLHSQPQFLEDSVKLNKKLKTLSRKKIGEFMGISKQEFYDWVAPMRDDQIWQQDTEGEWFVKDAIFHHDIGDAEERARIPQVDDRAFAPHNRHLYYNPDHPPVMVDNPEYAIKSKRFRSL